jgi:adenine-specific DNA methylase
MKYMGSKRWMLQNGLGHTLDDASARAKRFVDLFAGSGAVVAHVATKCAIPVVAYDLQKFSVVLTRAIVGRDKKLDVDKIWKEWKKRAARIAARSKPPSADQITKAFVGQCRRWSESRKSLPITKAYGGHYFSPMQAVWIDALRKTLPAREPGRTVALAALIQAASESAASPGHTAQPFQPTRSAKKFLKEAWSRDICDRVNRALGEIAETHAQTVGKAKVGDANKAVSGIRKGDLVFIDPPYSGVHYSRFYHVLETIARGKCGPVSGVGRYPNTSERPRSRYSIKTKSVDAFEQLLKSVSDKKASAIVTFPAHECSNGLSGKETKRIAKQYFAVTTKTVNSKFSTLGGTQITEGKGNGRAARQRAKELILILRPKKVTRNSRTGRSP